MANVNISNVEKAVTIKSTDEINVETISVTDVDYFIYAEYLNQNLSIYFESSSLDLGRQAIFVSLNYTKNIRIELLNTSVTGLGIDGAIRITDARGRPRDILTTVDVHIENSIIETEHYNSRFIYLYSCYVHFNFMSSLTEFRTKSDTVYLYSQSANFDVSQNQFLQGSKAFSIQFCAKTFENEGADRQINIYNNTFKLHSTSDHIYYYNWYRREHVHKFHIKGNIFKQGEFGYGRGFYYQSKGYNNYPNHDVYLTDNGFEGYLTALKINGRANNITITGNTFVNNSEVLALNQHDYYAESVVFSSNVVKDNHDIVKYNDLEGVIQLIPHRSDTVMRISLIGNVFENNTKTIITTPSPYLLIRHNFFENSNATYNLKVFEDTRYTIANNEVLNASLNYWGSTDVRTIANKIYDNDYDESLFDIVFRPYLGSRNLSDIQNEDAGFISPNGEIGGPLSENVTLTADASPYLVTYNIEVEEKGVLILEAGVTLLFEAAQGISVVGKYIQLFCYFKTLLS